MKIFNNFPILNCESDSDFFRTKVIFFRKKNLTNIVRTKLAIFLKFLKQGFAAEVILSIIMNKSHT